MLRTKTVRLKIINKRKTQAGSSAQGRLRIIGGSWRSRVLPVPDAEGLRPTTDRVRETLFNWLQTDVPGSRCLDLFAGSGALGLEAASRGAREVVMIEKASAVYKTLQQNIKTLDASQVSVINQDALDFLKQQQATTFDGSLKFDIVFLDPPYQSALLPPAIDLLPLAVGTKVYLEARKGDDIAVPKNWTLLKDKFAGQIHYSLFEIEG